MHPPNQWPHKVDGLRPESLRQNSFRARGRGCLPEGVPLSLQEFLLVGGGGGRTGKETRPPPNPPAVLAVARVNVRAGPNDAHWKALGARELGIKPPLMTTEDYYALRWAVYVSYHPHNETCSGRVRSRLKRGWERGDITVVPRVQRVRAGLCAW